MDSRDQVLRGKTVRLVKVLLRECEDTIRTNYPFLFKDEGIILLRGEECKTQANFNFCEKWKKCKLLL